jgi:transmembrane 9 superfamily protein 2/4
VLWYYGSSAAIPFFTLVALLALWFGVSVPLTFVGAYFGFRKPMIEQPVRTNQIPRQIPDQSIYTQVTNYCIESHFFYIRSTGNNQQTYSTY